MSFNITSIIIIIIIKSIIVIEIVKKHLTPNTSTHFHTIHSLDQSGHHNNTNKNNNNKNKNVFSPYIIN
jgi:hypothetical protein